MDQLKNRRNLGTVLVIVLALVVAGGVAWKRHVDNDDPKLLSTMSLKVEGMGLKVEGMGQNYCANLIAYEVEQNQIDITITNCGDDTFKIDYDMVNETLAAHEEYSTKLPPDVNEFDVTITTTEGEFLGGFQL